MLTLLPKFAIKIHYTYVCWSFFSDFLQIHLLNQNLFE